MVVVMATTEEALGLGLSIGFILLAVLGIIFTVYQLTAIPTFLLAKKHYKNAWFAFIPLLDDLLIHDMSFGKSNRKWFLIYLGTAIIGRFLSSIGESNQNDILSALGYIAIALGTAYKFYSSFKLYKAFGASTVLFVVQLIPIVGLVIYWYIALSSQYQYVGVQPHIANKKDADNFY